MSTPEPHPALTPLLPLVGTWRGTGRGDYPTIEPFAYVEEVVLAPGPFVPAQAEPPRSSAARSGRDGSARSAGRSGPGKPFLAYDQRTRDAADDGPLHAETGYWRPVGDGGLEVVIVQPTGITERLLGTWDGSVAELADDDVRGTPTAKSVTRTVRRFELDGDVLRYSMSMAAVGHGLTHHLAAELHRVT